MIRKVDKLYIDKQVYNIYIDVFTQVLEEVNFSFCICTYDILINLVE